MDEAQKLSTPQTNSPTNKLADEINTLFKRCSTGGRRRHENCSAPVATRGCKFHCTIVEMTIIKKANNNNAGKNTGAENINWPNNCETEDRSSSNENRITVPSSTPVARLYLVWLCSQQASYGVNLDSEPQVNK